MTDERVRLNALPSTFPRLFPTGQLAWGFEVGDGWVPLIELLCARIDALLQTAPNASFTVMQVKEKFGTLRFYYLISNASDQVATAVQLAVEAAEKASQHICERCGASGETTDMKGWRMTLCPDCAKDLTATDHGGTS